MILATLCYLEKDNKILMLYRNKKENDYHEGKWNAPGGKFEPGESPEECVIREMKEETGLTIKNPVLKGVITFPMFDGKNDWYVFLFRAFDFTGEIIESPEGSLEWIQVDELLNLNLWEGDKTFIPWLFEEKQFSAKFIYKEKNLKDFQVYFY